jgi:hypothetical protein
LFRIVCKTNEGVAFVRGKKVIDHEDRWVEMTKTQARIVEVDLGM